MKIVESHNTDFMCKLLSLKLQKETTNEEGSRYFVLTEGSVVFGIAKINKKAEMLIWVENEEDQMTFNEAIIDFLVKDSMFGS